MGTIKGTEKSETITGTPQSDTIFGLGGNDIINPLAGVDAIYGGDGVDTVKYMYSDDGFRIDLLLDRAVNRIDGGTEVLDSIEWVLGSQGNDIIAGDDGNNVLEGEKGNDKLYGRGGNDRLYGESGNDYLDGGKGNDSLIGGAGIDTLIGGEGDDRFVFVSVGDSTATKELALFDTIKGFDAPGPWIAAAPGDLDADVIDLSAIDANTHLSGNQAFKFLGDLPSSQAVTTPGTLWLSNTSGGYTMVYGNTDTEADREFVLRIDDGATSAAIYDQFDFVL